MATANFDVIQTVPRVATLIYQTHKLWQEVKNVPDGIMGLVDQLKALESIFSDIEDQFNEDGASASFKNCLELSKKAHDSLGVLVADMRTQLQANKKMKRKYAAVKILLNKAVLERLEQSLSRCMTFLQLAIQAYQMAMLRKLSSQTTSARFQPQHHAQVQQLLPQPPQTKMPQNQFNDDDSLIVHRSATGVSKKTSGSFAFSLSKDARFALTYTDTGAWQAQVQLPSWLSRSMYEFMSRPSIAGWTYSYRVYNIVPNDSEIMMRIQAGDVVGVQELFSSRRASPFDRSMRNESLLREAAYHQQYEICQLLLNLGLQSELDEGDRPRRTPLADIALAVITDMVGKRQIQEDTMPRKIAKLFSLYLQEPDALPAERLLDFVIEYSGNDHEVRIFQELFMPTYYFRLLRERLEVARLGAFVVLSPKTLRNFISEGGIIKKTDVSRSTREKLSLVHSAAIGFGCRYPEELVTYQRPIGWFRAYGSLWGSFVVDIASMADQKDLHSIEDIVPWDAYQVTTWRGTPFISVIGATLCYLCPDFSLYHWDRMLQGSIRKWLSLSKEAGVDLVEYGKREMELLGDPDDSTRGAFDAHAIERSRCIIRRQMNGVEPVKKLCPLSEDMCWNDTHWIPLRIIDFKIGPEPGDWEIIWAPEFEYMAYEFWMCIESNMTRMPGAWVD
ncbi:hypothetical protein V8C40DRAFT_228975 [Trichoderma camerunense]